MRQPVRAVRDEEPAGSNPATPTTETAGHGISGDRLPLSPLPVSDFWEPDGSGRSSLQSRQGHRREAVQAAAQALFDNHMPAKLGVPPGAKDLVAMVFSTDPPTAGNPRLRLNDYSASSQNWTSQHEGHSFLRVLPDRWQRRVIHAEVDHLVDDGFGRMSSVACCPWAIIPSSKASNPISAASIA